MKAIAKKVLGWIVTGIAAFFTIYYILDISYEAVMNWVGFFRALWNRPVQVVSYIAVVVAIVLAIRHWLQKPDKK